MYLQPLLLYRSFQRPLLTLHNLFLMMPLPVPEYCPKRKIMDADIVAIRHLIVLFIIPPVLC